MTRRYKRAPKIKEVVQERLSVDELAYHLHVISTVREAEGALSLAKFVGDQWFQYLMNRYGLAKHEIVDSNGAIHRDNGEC